MLDLIESGKLSWRYRVTFGLVMLQLVGETFDFVLASYLVSALAPRWSLTFGETTIVLMSAGIGAIFGALFFGWLADRIGRKPTMIIGSFLYSLSAGAVAFLPEGGWIGFSVLRFLVGFGYGGAVASQFALITEYTPLRYRTLLGGALAIPGSIGVLAASTAFSTLYPVLGWRGAAALGFLPVTVAIALLLVAPESARWLVAQGKFEKARLALSNMLGRQVEAIPTNAPEEAPVERGSYGQLLANPRALLLVVIPQIGLGTALAGALLWGPTVVSMVLEISPQAAAADFILITMAGLLGRGLFAVVPHWIGRVPAGAVSGFAGAAALATVGLFGEQYLLGISVLVAALMMGQLFYEGGFANIITYGAELYSTRLASFALGVSQAAGGVGKVLGPLILGLCAGAGNLVTPQASKAAVTPGFLSLAVFALSVGLVFLLIGIETNPRKAGDIKKRAQPAF